MLDHHPRALRLYQDLWIPHHAAVRGTQLYNNPAELMGADCLRLSARCFAENPK
jgi:hypothetical protein